MSPPPQSFFSLRSVFVTLTIQMNRGQEKLTFPCPLVSSESTHLQIFHWTIVAQHIVRKLSSNVCHSFNISIDTYFTLKAFAMYYFHDYIYCPNQIRRSLSPDFSPRFSSLNSDWNTSRKILVSNKIICDLSPQGEMLGFEMLHIKSWTRRLSVQKILL